MTQLLDKREEGLRALARMIAAAYRRRMTGETAPVLTASDNDDEQLFPQSRKRHHAEPKDLRHEGEYTETVSVENFLRNKNHHNTQKTKVVNTKGGENVANKGSIRNSETATAGQNQAGNQKGK
ncbi:hypothetical protein [Dehalococcoides mccartyi]|uniref:hypothetical protein n=1 Tax=Dehalococcoides mccartyi TaxID=61435 RepID=UPI00117DCF33|nr:hypothetical protein [Dehalococcoides mccartyi]